jgi:hypothetical protein
MKEIIKSVNKNLIVNKYEKIALGINRNCLRLFLYKNTV